MYANQKVLVRDGRFTVRTKHDALRTEMLIVSGHRVLVAPNDLTFHDIKKNESVEVRYPAGTGFMYNGEQKIYQIFPEGMYQMLRSRSHAVRGERDDSRQMREMQQLTFDFVGQLRTWSLLGDEGQDFTDQSLVALANSLDHPKRNERKLKAARHYRKAGTLRNGNGTRLAMPAAFTASAGAQQLDHRRADVQVILGWLGPERLSIFGLLQGVHERLDDAWRTLSPQAFEGGRNNVIAIAAANPTAQSTKVLRDHMRPLMRGLKEIRVRPLNRLALDAYAALTTLGKKIVEARQRVDVSAEILAARAPLATMKVIRSLEIDAITPLSMILHRWNQLEVGQQKYARERVLQACQSTIATFQFEAATLPENTFKTSMTKLRTIAEIASDGKEDPRKVLMSVKRGLKRLSADLA